MMSSQAGLTQALPFFIAAYYKVSSPRFRYSTYKENQDNAMPMSTIQEHTHPDAKLVIDAIIELNISRHKAGIYPEGHPEIDASLGRAYETFLKLFEVRGQITLAAAKDTLYVDECLLDKNHPVYREVALCLSSKSISSITFARGLSKEELHTFNRFLSRDTGDLSPDDLEEEFHQHGLSYIKAEFIDYEAFSFAEERPDDDNLKRGLWARYVQELIRGNLRSKKYAVIREIPPDIFARLINAVDKTDLTDDASDRVMTTYLWQSLEKVSLITDLNKLIKFINRLRPGLKKQFLSSSFRKLPRDISLTEEMLKEIPADEALDFLDAVNESRIGIPDAIKNLIEKLSMLTPEGFQGRSSGKELIIDDIPLPFDIRPISGEDDFRKFVSDTYSEELQTLLTYDVKDSNKEAAQQFGNEWDDETLEKSFNQILIELISSSTENLITEHNYEYFSNLLKEQIEHFIGTGQYGQVLKIFNMVTSKTGDNSALIMNLDLLMADSAAILVDSLRIVGGQNREDALLLCEYYGHRIVAPLMDALMNEDSRKARKFLLDLVIRIADEAVPEAIKRLDDKRWYVKRNMLFILSESSSKEALPYVRPYIHHDNVKVSFHALRYLLKVDERYGVAVLQQYLRSGVSDKVEMALIIAGAFGVKAIVPDLLAMLKKAAKRGPDWEQKIFIVKALGQIADPTALVALKDILEAKSLFFRDPLKRLKEEVANTLKCYPPHDVRTVIGII